MPWNRKKSAQLITIITNKLLIRISKNIRSKKRCKLQTLAMLQERNLRDKPHRTLVQLVAVWPHC